jgi:imidazolonepropionase
VRQRSQAELTDLTRRRLAHLLANGASTVEVKSGYGLELAAELKQLEVIAAVAADGGPAVVPTFLGAHEVPEEYRPRTEEYLELVIHEMLPAVAQRKAARFCDVFCEPGVYTVAQSRRVLEAARRHGMEPKLHADELDPSGGAELAAALGAVSADHLAAISEAGIAALAASRTVAVLLPGTMMYLGQRRQAPGRQLIDAGAAVALATDFNPGSSPGMSLPLMATLAVAQSGLVPAETVTAITVNGAAAVGEAHTRGQIAPGFRADLALAAVEDWRELVYWYGTNLISEVWVLGMPCDRRQGIVNFLV